MNLTEWAKEVHRLSRALGQNATVSLHYGIFPFDGREYLWRADVGFLIEDPPGRCNFEGVRVFSAPTVEEATRAAIIALQKQLKKKIEEQKIELERLEAEANLPKIIN